MKTLFTSKNVIIMALLAIICIFLVNMLTKRETVVFNNHYKSYECSDDDILSDNDSKLDNTYTTQDRTLA